MAESVKELWVSTCNEVGVVGDPCLRWWEFIAARYTERGRHYHTLQHINDMLEHMAHTQELGLLAAPSDVALAVFFHDVIYDPKASDNEEQSAVVFQKFADECLKKDGSCSVNVQHVYDMILLTKSHQTEEHLSEHRFGANDEHYLLDLDMAILGQEDSVYDSYADNIRKEYIHIEEGEYCKRRAQVLRNVMKAPKIYCTKDFHHKYEEKARANCSREIARLADNKLS